MTCTDCFITIRVLKDLPGYKAGQEVKVTAVEDGIPLLKFWRDRLRDAEIDDCVEVIPNPKPTSSKKVTSNDSD